MYVDVLKASKVLLKYFVGAQNLVMIKWRRLLLQHDIW